MALHFFYFIYTVAKRFADEVFRLKAEFCSTALLHKALKLQLCDATMLIHAVQFVSPLFYPIAFAKSSIKSSASSMPTLKRIKPSTKPFFKRSSRGMLACVMLAG
jgi:hypothetical protein